MKRIQKACLTQTVIFSNHNGETTAYARKLIEEEYKKYIKKLDVSRTKYQLFYTNDRVPLKDLNLIQIIHNRRIIVLLFDLNDDRTIIILML